MIVTEKQRGENEDPSPSEGTDIEGLKCCAKTTGIELRPSSVDSGLFCSEQGPSVTLHLLTIFTN